MDNVPREEPILVDLTINIDELRLLEKVFSSYVKTIERTRNKARAKKMIERIENDEPADSRSYNRKETLPNINFARTRLHCNTS